MRHAQVVVYESDGALAEQISDLARENGWLVRESRQPDACVNYLCEARPAALLLKLERKMIDELTLLFTINEKVPDCPVVVISDVKLDGARERSNLSALAYDLGARFVMFPPLTKTVVEDLVSGLMAATIRRLQHLTEGACDA
jgi:DNA-binding NtrC family response regulator